LREKLFMLNSQKVKKERIVFLHKKLKNILKEYRLRSNGYILISERDGIYSERTIQQIVKNTAEKADITKKVTPHVLQT